MPNILIRIFACLLCVFTATNTFAGPFALHVDADGVDRKNCPVIAELLVPSQLTLDEIDAWKKPGAALSPGNIPVHIEPVKDANGKIGSAKLYWVEPELKAGETKVYKIGAWALNGLPAGFEFVDGESTRDLKMGTRLVWRHDSLKYDAAKHNDTFKHFHQVYAFDQDNGFITQGIGGKQFPHHRGLYMGWNKTSAGGNSYDTWHCTNGVAVRHREFVKDRDMTGYVLCRSSSVSDWTAKDGKPIVIENREVTTWYAPQMPGVTLMDFSIKLTSGGGDVKLDGDPQHAGFQFRAAGEVGTTKAKYIRPASAKDKGGDVWEGCEWIAMTFKIKDKPYAVAYFDHPKNPGTDEKKTVFSTRDYGRFGAFAKLDLKEGAPLQFNYRIIVLDTAKHGDVSVEHFAKLHEAWVKPVKVKIGPG